MKGWRWWHTLTAFVLLALGAVLGVEVWRRRGLLRRQEADAARAQADLDALLAQRTAAAEEVEAARDVYLAERVLLERRYEAEGMAVGEIVDRLRRLDL